MDALPFNVKYLTENEINYELRIRNVNALKKTLDSRRLILERCITNNTEILNFSDKERNGEKTAISISLIELEFLVHDFSATKEDTSYLLISTRLKSLYNRVNRFEAPSEPEEEKLEFLEFKNDSLATILEIEAILHSKIKPILSNKISESEGSYSAKSIPVYKWGINFNGKTSVKAFLERVQELSIARNVSEKHLFESAIDLFDGQALVWYRAIKTSVNSWKDLVKQMENAFLPLEYDEKLLDEIKQHRQANSESIHIYIAIMKELFRRLPVPLAERDQLKIIRKNILARYIDPLALVEISSTEDLISRCVMLDEARQIKNNSYAASTSANSCLLEGDLSTYPQASTSSPEIWLEICIILHSAYLFA